MRDAAFPANMPRVWDELWGYLNEITGTPVVLGEWGGLWPQTAPVRARRPPTHAEPVPVWCCGGSAVGHM